MPVSDFFKDRCNALLPGGYAAFFPKNIPVSRGITVNTLRCPTQEFAANSPFAVQPSGFSPCNLRLLEQNVKVGTHPYHHAGVYYAQEPSASAPAALLGVQPGDMVLDLCAAPGGKTAQLGAALAGKGALYTNELMPDRARVLLSNAERMGLTNAVILNDSAEHIAAAFPEFFDRILVDAPCSGEGMFRKEAVALTQHSQRLVESCAALGAALLETISAALRPGGVLLYSTCTFSPEEDEGVIGAFLKRHPGEFTLEDTGASFGCAGHESCCVGGALDVSRVRRIYPIHGGEGHFMAKLKKCGEAPRRLPPAKSQIQSAVPPDEVTAFLDKTFPALAGQPINVSNEKCYLLPECPLYLPRGVHALRAGVLAGELIKKRFEPHHHLFTAYGTLCANAECLTAEDLRCAEYLRGAEIDAKTAQNGFAAVLVDGFALGMGKVSSARLKNRYPKGLRNLK